MVAGAVFTGAVVAGFGWAAGFGAGFGAVVGGGFAAAA